MALYEEEKQDDCGADHHRQIVTALKAQDRGSTAWQLMDHHLADIEGQVRLTEGRGDRHTFLAVLENFS